MQVSMLIYSMPNLPKHLEITESIITMEENEAGWSYVYMSSVLKQNVHKIHARSVTGMDVDVGTL